MGSKDDMHIDELDNKSVLSPVPVETDMHAGKSSMSKAIYNILCCVVGMADDCS